MYVCSTIAMILIRSLLLLAVLEDTMASPSVSLMGCISLSILLSSTSRPLLSQHHFRFVFVINHGHACQP